MVGKKAQLLYDGTCPKCKTVKAVVSAVDVGNHMEMIPLESNEGTELVEQWHSGEYVHAPHYRYGEALHWGVEPCAKAVAMTLPFIIYWGIRNSI